MDQGPAAVGEGRSDNPPPTTSLDVSPSVSSHAPMAAPTEQASAAQTSTSSNTGQGSSTSFNMSSMANTLPEYPQDASRMQYPFQQPTRFPQVSPPTNMLYPIPPSTPYGSQGLVGMPSPYSYTGQVLDPNFGQVAGMTPLNQGYVPGSTVHTAGFGGQYPSYPANYQGQPGYTSTGYGDQLGRRLNAPPGQINPQVVPRYISQQGQASMPATNLGLQGHHHQGATGSQIIQTVTGQGSRPTGASQTSVLRGPPRKPKLSGHALWVGNLPAGANILDLKEHFSRGAKHDIMSVFLMSSTNCAFVNYKTDAACAAALERFNEAPFQGTKLLCRYRRSGLAPATSEGPKIGTTSEIRQSDTPLDAETEQKPSSAAEQAGLGQDAPSASDTIQSSTNQGSLQESKDGATVPKSGLPISQTDAKSLKERYFIMKSLTVEDLDQSVYNGYWATQSHNEAALNRAYEQAEVVYLIFGANKTGEYFGYARMASSISNEPDQIPETEVPPPAAAAADLPQDIPTEETEFAPKGHIVDDRSRGTIFWEAEIDSSIESAKENADAPSDKSETGDEDVLGQERTRGNRFAVEWVSLTRVPFHQTRGLRNLWNANREIKIARDGTELETSVGRRLLQLFDRPQRARSGPSNAPHGPYRAAPGYPRT